VVILRPFSIYGPHEPPHRLIPAAIRAGRDGTVLPLTPPGCVRDFVFVEDVVEACLQAAVAEEVVGETINIGTGVQTSNEEVVRCIEQSLGRTLRIDQGAYAPHPTDTSCWRADITRARELLKWRPQHTLRAGIDRTVAWTLEQDAQRAA
jgi:nucleoside-diphosphate-sugar epimerase